MISRTLVATALVVLSVSSATAAFAQGADAANDTTIAIVGATVHTAPGEVIESATIVIRDGRVRAVGADAAVPAGARRIEAAGKVVTAGFIEGSSRLGLIEVSLESSTREGSFRGKGDDVDDVIHAAYRALDGYNPNSVAIPVARSGGVTSAVAAPQGGLVSGTGVWVTLLDGGPESARARSIVVPTVAMYAALGEASLDSAGGSRGMAIERLRQLFDDAREYDRRRAAYDRGQSREMIAGRLDLAAMIPVLQRRIPLVVRADRSSDILAALRLSLDSGVRVIIHGGTEAWMLGEQLAAANVGVMLDPTANLPGSFDRIHVREDAAKLLVDAGVTVAISTLGSAANVRTLRQLAGIAVANGLSHEQALAAVTSAPADLFDVDRGRIAVGQAADLVVWSGDPFELSTRAEQVLIGGVVQRDRSRQTLLRERYRTLPGAQP
ncbi:MAG: amidohydrolase family protein [Haliangiales bacterium]